jgi:hypothetical protein
VVQRLRNKPGGSYHRRAAGCDVRSACSHGCARVRVCGRAGAPSTSQPPWARRRESPR